ncbi:MAG TPA: DNA mismatch repair protein MutS, partial [Candidatus Methanoperedenaceae archaeon]|nr:DNA mismatch repair protein MutS [Candidatus Methanoperedenaceae archaeon]
MPYAISAAGAALSYAKETQRSALSHISGLSTRMRSRYMMLDAITLRNLEILRDIRGESNSTLAGVLDMTGTPMGSRLLLRALASPLLDINEINGRLDAVEFLYKTAGLRAALGEKLRQCADIERIAGRISYGNVSPRDLVSLMRTLLLLPGIKSLFSEAPPAISGALADMKDLGDAAALIQGAIVNDPPALARSGNVIRAGFNKQLDELRELSGSGKQWIANLQQSEREKTGIKSLKIGYNQVFGYYIEVTKPNVSLVPPHYERKQTTSNAERYTIPELREKELLIQNADERLAGLESEIFNQVVGSLRAYVGDLQCASGGIAALDMYHALSEVAATNNYVRPVLEHGSRIAIRDGRHPVVEL